MKYWRDWLFCSAKRAQSFVGVGLLLLLFSNLAVCGNEKSSSADAGSGFWAFQPLNHSVPPRVTGTQWCRTPADHFILAKLEAKGLRPNPPADRRKLIRRAYFDLLGLPPTPAEIEAFANDQSPDAYDRLIDRLLGSPQYGERWARHWLDLARFAESHGFEHDYDRPTAYHYRDFVIEALNADLPYDTFVKWQIAGDELAPENRLALKATGFLAAGVHATQITANQAEKERYDELDDMLGTIGTSMLGLTVGCARCHDHKYDPIPSADYYRMLSTFTTTVRSELDVELEPERYRAAKARFDFEHGPLLRALDNHERSHFGLRFASARKQPLPMMAWHRSTELTWLALDHAVRNHEKQMPKPALSKMLISTEGLPAVRLHTQGPDFYDKTYFLKRGDPNQKGEEAPPGYLRVLMRGKTSESRWRFQPPPGGRTSYRRAGLAAWLTDIQNGAGELLARVVVNRLWQHHFGRGLVATPSDFGVQGERPSHPELLDWLAAELIRNGWRFKSIHKLIMTSAVYQQSSSGNTAANHIDPENSFCWRHMPRRLEGEIIRDAMLSVSGMLDGQMFGPGSLDEGQRRRSIYFTIKRSGMIPFLAQFDAPDALQSLGQRSVTTVAPQALLLMNNVHLHTYARAFAKRLQTGARSDDSEMVRRAYLTALGRPPDSQELTDAIEFLAGQTRVYESNRSPLAPELALADFCQALFCINEFVYID